MHRKNDKPAFLRPLVFKVLDDYGFSGCRPDVKLNTSIYAIDVRFNDLEVTIHLSNSDTLQEEGRLAEIREKFSKEPKIVALYTKA
jgi:hypothetical protein